MALGTIVTLGTAPIFTALISRLCLREHLSLRWLLATLAAIFGCVLIVVPGQDLGVDVLGFGLALVAAACYGVYTVSAKRMLHDHPPLAVIATTSGIGGLLLAPIAFGQLHELSQPRSVGAILWLGLVVTALAYLLFARSLRGVSAATVGTLGLAEPLAAVLLGVLILGERLSLVLSAGVVLLFAGLVFVATDRRRAAG